MALPEVRKVARSMNYDQPRQVDVNAPMMPERDEDMPDATPETRRLVAHTPKPYRWQLRESHEYREHEPPVADYLSDADARRLAACWNAVIDWDTEFLERFAADPASPGLPAALKAATDRIQELEAALRETAAMLDRAMESFEGLAVLGVIERADTYGQAGIDELRKRNAAALTPPQEGEA